MGVVKLSLFLIMENLVRLAHIFEFGIGGFPLIFWGLVGVVLKSCLEVD